ncbi:MAG: TolC family protein [Ramlibacter sp.]
MFCIPWTRSVAAAAALAHFAAPLLAAEPLTLAQAQLIATGRSQQLAAQGAVTRAARDIAVSAGQLPDPVLKFGVDNLPVNGPDRLSLSRDFMTMRRIGLSQEITRSDKRQLKAERFERDAERAQAQRQLVFAGLQRDTALAWLEVYYTQAMRTLVQQLLEETRLQGQGADIAFRSGRGSQADVFAARAASVMQEDRLSQLDRQTRSAVLMLARWVGADATRPLAGQPAWQTSAIANAVDAEHLRQHPQLAAMAAQLEAAQTDARLAQANTQSDWTVEAAYQQRGRAFSNMVSIGVSVPLQLDQKNRQNREIAARLARVEEAQANYEDMLRAHEAEVGGLINDWQNGKERIVRYRTQLLPIAGQRTEAALTAYRVGKSDLASALAARRDEIDTRVQALTLELETARLWAQLNYLAADSGKENP